MDPRENRLTEAFAAVLERDAVLARDVVAGWTALAVPDGNVSVRTQRLTASGGFIDLELGFGPPAAPDLRVWVEIKHGASLHENQLETYLNDLKIEHHSDARLVFLAPRGAADAVPEDVTAVEWQNVASFLRAYARRADVKEVSRWLSTEFYGYLKEEGLTDEEALTPAHAFALAARPAADRATARLIEYAHIVVAKEWGAPKSFLKKSGSQKPAYGVDWWATYHTSSGDIDGAPTWGSAWFEWTIRTDDFRAEPRDAIGLFAGAAFPTMKGSALSKASNEPWIAAVAAAGFERVSAWYWRLWRPLYPEQLMVEETLEAQGRRLGDWVVAAFRELEETPPPT